MGFYAISDIHGNLNAFKDLLHQVTIDFSRDKLYILGDMVDWGKQSLDTLLFVMHLNKEYPNNVHVTLGNHEMMLLSDIEGNPLAKLSCISNNGSKTKQQITKLRFKNTELYFELKRWLYNLPIMYEDGNYILTHSVPPRDGNILSYDYYAMHSSFPTENVNAVWVRADRGKNYGNKTLISGHTITGNHRVFISYNYINIDCGAKLLGYGEGRLALLKVDDRNNEIKVWYSEVV